MHSVERPRPWPVTTVVSLEGDTAVLCHVASPVPSLSGHDLSLSQASLLKTAGPRDLQCPEELLFMYDLAVQDHTNLCLCTDGQFLKGFTMTRMLTAMQPQQLLWSSMPGCKQKLLCVHYSWWVYHARQASTWHNLCRCCRQPNGCSRSVGACAGHMPGGLALSTPRLAGGRS